jgi:hypothetical protein
VQLVLVQWVQLAPDFSKHLVVLGLRACIEELLLLILYRQYASTWI